MSNAREEIQKEKQRLKDEVVTEKTKTEISQKMFENYERNAEKLLETLPEISFVDEEDVADDIIS